MSLASSHNAVYRIVDGFQPLLDEYEVKPTCVVPHLSIQFNRILLEYSVRRPVASDELPLLIHE